MRSLVSDLIPEYNKKFHLKKKKDTLVYVVRPPFSSSLTTSPCVHHYH